MRKSIDLLRTQLQKEWEDLYIDERGQTGRIVNAVVSVSLAALLFLYAYDQLISGPADGFESALYRTTSTLFIALTAAFFRAGVMFFPPSLKRVLTGLILLLISLILSAALALVPVGWRPEEFPWLPFLLGNATIAAVMLQDWIVFAGNRKMPSTEQIKESK